MVQSKTMWLVIVKVMMPYPSEREFTVGAGNAGLAVSRAWKLARQDWLKGKRVPDANFKAVRL